MTRSEYQSYLSARKNRLIVLSCVLWTVLTSFLLGCVWFIVQGAQSYDLGDAPSVLRCYLGIALCIVGGGIVTTMLNIIEKDLK